MAAATHPPANTTNTNLDWLLSEPLFDAALKQTKSLKQLDALQDSFRVAEEAGKDIPESFRVKLDQKHKELHALLVEREVNEYLSRSGLGHLVYAKRKWDDVHFMAEAHGVGSSIPMVGYTGLSQEDMEKGMTSFYEYLAKNSPLKLDDKSLQGEVAQRISSTYQEMYETATGEFGGYNPFDQMVDHPPEKVAIALGVKVEE